MIGEAAYKPLKHATQSSNVVNKQRVRDSRLDIEAQNMAMAPWRGKGHRKLYRLILVTCVYLMGIIVIIGLKARDGMWKNQLQRDTNSDTFGAIMHGDLLRHKREIVVTTLESVDVPLHGKSVLVILKCCFDH